MIAELTDRFGCSPLTLTLAAALQLGTDRLSAEDFDPPLRDQVLLVDCWFKAMPAEISKIFAWEILLNDS